MGSKNICKIPISNFSNELNVTCFVFETNLDIIKKPIKLLSKRLILIEQGDGVAYFENERYSFSAGTLLFGFENETFYISNPSNVQYFYIDFNGLRSDALFERFGIYPSTRKVQNFNSLIPFCKNSLFNTPSESVDIAAESVLLHTFSQMATSSSSENGIIQKIVEITKDRFNDTELSLSSIANELGYNVKYVSHFFKEKMNVGYSEYLRSIRFKYAISLFEHGLNSIKNVSYLSGFSDPLYFSNAFKKYVGLSPKDFIASLNKENNKKEWAVFSLFYFTKNYRLLLS